MEGQALGQRLGSQRWGAARRMDASGPADSSEGKRGSRGLSWFWAQGGKA